MYQHPMLRLILMRRSSLIIAVGLLILSLALASLASGEGSRTIYRTSDPNDFRSHLEWRTSSYGDSPEFNLRRRTLLFVYAEANEEILLGSSGIAVGGAPGDPDAGDIRVFNPGVVRTFAPNAANPPIGQEPIPDLTGVAVPPQDGAAANGFSCVAQRTASGNAVGRIADRTQELAGPLPTPGGFEPCVYVAPETGIYAVVFTGPSGPDSNAEPVVSGLLDSPAADYGPLQRTSVTAWDVTVRNAGVEQPGRLFAYYYTGNTGGGGRPVTGQAVVVTDTGFRYRVTFEGDPFGFLFYVNRVGFQNSDGTPLYRNLLADPTAPTQSQNQLLEVQGGVALLPPEYPIFINTPDPLVLNALSIPLTPIAPFIRNLAFSGPTGTTETTINVGGEFSFETTQAGIYYIVVSRDRTNFDPTEPSNRVLRGVATAPGPVTVAWDGRDNAGTAFPVGEFLAAAAAQGGEVHFPFLDVENNVDGGPEIELINPPDLNNDGVGDCPPWNGGCFGAFYDDRGYVSAAGTLVGTAVNGPLCPGDAANPRGFGNPPLIAASDPVLGFDSRTNQRAFGFPFDANPSSVCLPTGGFGDKKGLDLWTYYPSNILQAPLVIVDPTAITLRRFTVTREGETTVLHWETGVELGTQGFHILRGVGADPAAATRITATLIPARGSATRGGAYSWSDATARPDQRYTYWLEEVEVNGVTNVYGPAQSGTVPTDLRYRVALPLIMTR
jgi:hypothetical protein